MPKLSPSARDAAAELVAETLRTLAVLESIKAGADGFAALAAEYAPGVIRTLLAGNVKFDRAVKRKSLKSLRTMVSEDVFAALVAEAKALSKPPYRLP